MELELSDVHKFKKLLDQLRQFKLNFDRDLESLFQNAVEQKEEELSREAASETINKLQEVRTDPGEILLMSGDFWISDLDFNQFKFTYRHPVSNYINKNVVICFCLEEQHWKHGSNKSIYLNICGKIFSRINSDCSSWELEIKPIAVYS
ncbi:MAG: hypothetical protein ACFB4I_03060 [Cyanophyceae cyanobacterium]